MKPEFVLGGSVGVRRSECMSWHQQASEKVSVQIVVTEVLVMWCPSVFGMRHLCHQCERKQLDNEALPQP